MSDIVDTNVSQLDMVLVCCWEGEMDHKQAITHDALGARMDLWVHTAQAHGLS